MTNDNRELVKAIGDAARRINIGLRDVAAELRRMNTREDARDEDTSSGASRHLPLEGKAEETELSESDRTTIEALKCCAEGGWESCADCPICGKYDCSGIAIGGALDLIRRLLAEKGVEI